MLFAIKTDYAAAKKTTLLMPVERECGSKQNPARQDLLFIIFVCLKVHDQPNNALPAVKHDLFVSLGKC